MSPAEAEALKTVLSLNEGRAAVGTQFVFWGLVVEYLILFLSKDTSRRERILSIVCGLAIAGGVGAEYIFGGHATEAASQLREASEAEIARLNKEASDARLELVQTEVKVEDAKRANLELLKLILPRRLSNQMTPGLQALKEYAGTTLAVVSAPPDPKDLEPDFFAVSLGVIESADWKVKGVTTPPPVPGLTMLSPKTRSWSPPRAARPSDPVRERTWEAAEALRAHIKDVTGDDAAHWPIEDDPEGKIVDPRMAELLAAGVEYSDRLVVLYVGKRSLEMEQIRRQIREGEGR